MKPQCQLEVGDLVRFSDDFYMGVVLDTKLSDAFADEDLYEIKVYWFEHAMIFWCLDFTLIKL